MEGLIIFGLAIVAADYFLPTIVAAPGSKRKTGAIFVLNLFLGWTLLGWAGSGRWCGQWPTNAAADDYQPRA